MSEEPKKSYAKISLGWQKIFAGYEAGEPLLSGVPQNYSKLPMASRFSYLGFIFGPIYYIYLGMYHKALVLLALCPIIFLVFESIDRFFKRDFYHISYIPLSAICATLVKLDYYKWYRHRQIMWQPLAPLGQLPVAIGVVIASFALAFSVEIFLF